MIKLPQWIVFGAVGAFSILVAPAPAAAAEITLADDIVSNTAFSASNTYLVPLNKQLLVKSGATLTIAPGTLIRFEQGSSLVIARGSKVEALGTVDMPIVFTSAQPSGEQTSGFWGGVVVLGGAPINVNVLSNPPSDQACYEAVTAGPDCLFGGIDTANDSGTLRYVRIEFGGALFTADRRFNNLTLGGVGSATEIDYVQSHRGADDGIEIVGGTANLKHIVSSQNRDEAFSFDYGWHGKAQFLVAQHVSPDGSVQSSNGLESQNHALAASYVADPRTLPKIFNATWIGDPENSESAGSFAALLRRGTGGRYANVIMMDFPQGIEIREAATKSQLDEGNLYVKYSILYNNDALADGDNWPPPQVVGDIDEASYFELPAWANQFIDPGLSPARSDLNNPNFAPTSISAPLFIGWIAPDNDGFFDPDATFIGAIGTEDWTLDWTRYDHRPSLIFEDGFETLP